MILDGPMIRARRQDLGLSHRALAKRLGVSIITLKAIEAGTNHTSLPLRLVCSLAEHLAVDPVALFVNPTEAPETSDDELVEALGGVLADLNQVTPVSALAESLNVTLDELSVALEALDAHLSPVGLWVYRRSGGDVSLRPKQLRASLRKDVLRRHQAQRGLSMSEARVLYWAFHGDLNPKSLKDAHRLALNRLRRAGMITEEGLIALTVDVEVSLCLSSS